MWISCYVLSKLYWSWDFREVKPKLFEMMSAHLTSCHEAQTDAAQEQGSAGHSIPFITGQRFELHFCHFICSRFRMIIQRSYWCVEWPWNYNDWGHEKESRQSQAQPHTLMKATTFFLYHLPKEIRHEVSIWSFPEFVEVYETGLTTKQHSLYIMKTFCYIPVGIFKTFCYMRWTINSLRGLHVLNSVENTKTAYIKSCSWHKCKSWCQISWHFCGSIVEIQETIHRFLVAEPSTGCESSTHFSYVNCRHFSKRNVAVLINMFLGWTWYNFKGFWCYCLTFRLFPTRDR